MRRQVCDYGIVRQQIKVSNKTDSSVSDVDEHSPTGSESVTIQLVVNVSAETLFIYLSNTFISD